ncbi:hypothetical protein CI109_106840 [Kwoniella shandongensis]|uniref:Uncharacterized protein n=1 Tax=Kwoniella shandongensis TaxID=1734106 RepID=A0A5M6C6H2_9TREE|nr:uncharacterized protein CI109_000904 [Kwoniella shandongensis]KAA5530724.1 hypothetical protein CI109_000904 [Kwoniella shandongensis]
MPLPTSPRTRIILLGPLFLLIVLFLFHPFSQLSLLSSSSTSNQNFNGQNLNTTYPLSDNAKSQSRPKRIAIIGAGASGSSAAFFVRRAGRTIERRLGLEEGERVGEVVVFDKEGYVGGRSTTVYPHSDKRTRPQELGASVFVKANQNMMKATEYFNLTLIDTSYGEAGVGIWDGHQFLYSTSASDSTPSSWLDTARALMRYGPLSYARTKSSVGGLLKRFARLYDPAWLAQRGVVNSIEDFAEKVGLGREFTTRTGEDWAKNVVKASDRWWGEIMEGATRANYGSEMNFIHALGAGVSMAVTGASQVEGGNWQIFQNMLDNSKAKVHLGTEVKEIIPLDDGDNDNPRFHIKTNRTELNDDEPFDVVFFAAPWHSSRVSKDIEKSFSEQIPNQKYVHLHVTYLTTTQPHPIPSFFGLLEDASIPNVIITTGITARQQAIPPPRFQSIAWHGETYPGSGEYAVKIFSMTRLTDRFLREMLGEEPSWLLRKEWNSYPELRPLTSYAPVEPIKGLHYLGALEPWVSSMETQTISAREAVARVVNDWWGLGQGECEAGLEAWDWTC